MLIYRIVCCGCYRFTVGVKGLLVVHRGAGCEVGVCWCYVMGYVIKGNILFGGYDRR